MEVSAASCSAFSQVVLAGLFSLIVVIVVSLIVVKMVVGVGIVVSTVCSFVVSAIVLKFFSVARPFVVSTFVFVFFFVFFFVLFVVFVMPRTGCLCSKIHGLCCCALCCCAYRALLEPRQWVQPQGQTKDYG
jgi:hypothetical protein